eukprot:3451752-Prymnesium_polylepis.1
MKPLEGGGEAQHLRGRATRFQSDDNPDDSYYVVKLAPDEQAVAGSNDKLYICKLADAQPDSRCSTQCTDRNCKGKIVPQNATDQCIDCNGAPPMGKQKRTDPAL